MKVDVVMPEMGESIAEGTVAKWLRKPGDEVTRDETILEITTDKIDTEIPAPESGRLAELLVEEGATVAVGTVLARIDTEASGDQAAAVETPEASAETRAVPGETVTTGSRQAPAEEKEGPSDVPEKALSPVARNIALKEGLSSRELSEIDGSGRGGKVTKEDVVRFLERREDAPEEEAQPASSGSGGAAPAQRIQVIEMTQMRKRIAQHMVDSKRISPHTYTVAEVDMTRVVRFRESVKSRFEKDNGFSLTYTPFILHATVLALRAHPLMNSSLQDDKIIVKDFVNLGVAVALESGLIVPVIKNADEKNLLGLARTAHELAVRAQSKKLVPDDVQGGTFTVTNPGVFGNIFGLPIINQPQVGILGVGAIKKRPVVVDDAIAIRSIMYASLSYDHRVVDGALAARFVQEIRRILEDYDIDRAL